MLTHREKIDLLEESHILTTAFDLRLYYIHGKREMTALEVGREKALPLSWFFLLISHPRVDRKHENCFISNIKRNRPGFIQTTDSPDDAFRMKIVTLSPTDSQDNCFHFGTTLNGAGSAPWMPYFENPSKEIRPILLIYPETLCHDQIFLS